MAAYLVSEVLGRKIVPHTRLRDGPLGEGILQLWQETDPEKRAPWTGAPDEAPEEGWKDVLHGQHENRQIDIPTVPTCSGDILAIWALALSSSYFGYEYQHTRGWKLVLMTLCRCVG